METLLQRTNYKLKQQAEWLVRWRDQLIHIREKYTEIPSERYEDEIASIDRGLNFLKKLNMDLKQTLAS